MIHRIEITRSSFYGASFLKDFRLDVHGCIPSIWNSTIKHIYIPLNFVFIDVTSTIDGNIHHFSRDLIRSYRAEPFLKRLWNRAMGFIKGIVK